jgi:hypothetical protein
MRVDFCCLLLGGSHLAQLVFGAIDAYRQFVESGTGARQDFKCVLIRIVAQLLGVVFGGFANFASVLLRVQCDGVFGYQLLGVLLSIGHDAFCFAARVFGNALGPAARLLNHAFGIGARIGELLFRASASFVQCALSLFVGFTYQSVRFGLRAAHQTLCFGVCIGYQSLRLWSERR